MTLRDCALTGDAASCSRIIRTVDGIINEIDGTLQNLDSIRTQGVDLTVNYRSPGTGFGTFGFTGNFTWLTKYSLSESGGRIVIDRLGTERGSPDQAFPKFKGNATIDWSLGDVGASVTGRYIDSVRETTDQFATPAVTAKLNSRFYVDVQLSYAPSFADHRLAFTIGVNNVTNQDPPACFSCSLNNYDPTTYDVPGQFGYLRVTYHM